MTDYTVSEIYIRKLRIARRRTLAIKIINVIILIILALAVILPILLPWFFVFKTRLEFSYSPWSLPTQIRWNNFQEAWVAIKIGQGLLNTLWVCLGAIAGTVPAAAMAG